MIGDLMAARIFIGVVIFAAVVLFFDALRGRRGP